MAETFTFGRFRVSLDRKELWDDDQPARIGRRALAVLIALLRRPGDLVTKDDLVNEVWGGAAVEDNAIAAQIAALRRALGDGVGGERYIETVSGRGYRFVAALQAAPPRASNRATAVGRPPPTMAPAWRRWRRWRFAAGAIAVVAIVVAALVWRLRGETWRIERMEMVADSPLVSTEAAPSPNGAFIAFAAGLERDHRRVFLRSMSGGEPAPFTRGDGDEAAPAWSPVGDRIAFVRGRDGEPCAILIKPVLAGDERQVGRCRSVRSTTLAWSADGGSLFYYDRPTPDAASRIERLDVATGASVDVTRPPPGSDGDVTPEVSPDGRRLVFQRATEVLTGVFIRDLITGREKEITPPDLNVAGAAWADDDDLVVATNPPDPSALWIYPASGGAPQRLNLSPAEFQHLVASRAGLVGFESHVYRHALAHGVSSGEPETLESRTGLVNGLNASGSGAIVFARAPGGWGPWEIWVERPGRPGVQLTSLRASYAEGPRWSPDGRQIAFTASVGPATAVYVMAGDGSALRRMTSRVGAMAGPAWLADGKGLVYPMLGPQGWRLWEVALDAPGHERALDERGWLTVRSDGGDIYGLSLTGGVWRLGARPAQIARAITPQHSMDWDIGGGRLTYLDRSVPGAPRLIVHSLDGGADRAYAAPRPLVDDPATPAGVIGGVGFDPVAGRPLYVQATGGEVQVGVLRLVRR